MRERVWGGGGRRGEREPNTALPPSAKNGITSSIIKLQSSNTGKRLQTKETAVVDMFNMARILHVDPAPSVVMNGQY